MKLSEEQVTEKLKELCMIDGLSFVVWDANDENALVWCRNSEILIDIVKSAVYHLSNTTRDDERGKVWDGLMDIMKAFQRDTAWIEERKELM